MMERVYNNLNDLLENEDRAKGIMPCCPTLYKTHCAVKGKVSAPSTPCATMLRPPSEKNKLKSRKQANTGCFSRVFST